MTGKAPSNDPQPLAADSGTELRPCDFTGHMALTAEVARLRRWGEDAHHAIWRLNATIAERDAKICRYLAAWDRTMDDLDRARIDLRGSTLARDDLRTRLAERDAQVGRLTKRLSEGQG